MHKVTGFGTVVGKLFAQVKRICKGGIGFLTFSSLAMISELSHKAPMRLSCTQAGILRHAIRRRVRSKTMSLSIEVQQIAVQRPWRGVDALHIL